MKSFLLGEKDFSTINFLDMEHMTYERLCIKCKGKDPPVDTVLEPGVNISEGRYNRSDYTCDECYKERQKLYQHREKFAEYERQLHDETIEEFREQWNDPAYRNTKELSDRVHKVWDKYDRRSPEMGIRRDWICEVIFDDLWFIDANGIVETFFAENNKSKSKQLASKSILLEFVSSEKILERLQAAYKDRARNRWSGIVDAIIRKYAGKDKMVARPAHSDPYTKEMLDNYYLLSREQEREQREQIREAKKARMDAINIEEAELVKYRQKIAKRHKVRDTDTDDDNAEGGESK